jgi:hypothetical protein
MAFDFNKIKSLFVQGEETSTEQKTKNESEEKKTETINVGNKTQPSKPNLSYSGSGMIDQKFLDMFLKSIQEKNLPGEDYLEFLDALQAMKNIPLDERIKIQTVMATLSTKGLTVQKINESADYYKKVLDNEKKVFYDELNNQVKDQITSRQKEIEAADELIKVKSEQIAKLTKEITENQQNILNIKSQINESDLKLKNTENSFNATLNFVINQIDENLRKIESAK